VCKPLIVGIPGEPFPPSLVRFTRELRSPPTGLPPSPMVERYSRVGRSHKCGNRKVAGPRFVSTMTLSTLSQLKHSNVRTSKASRAVLTRVSTIGAWHLMQGRLSILSDV
jgi:hypothetical protein